MLSKNTVKFIKTLHQKKYRNLERKFLVEGEKSVLEVLNSSFSTSMLFGTSSFFEKNSTRLSVYKGSAFEVNQKQLESLGTFKSNKDALIVVEMKDLAPVRILKDEIILALDEVKDPGNLGTIIRIADWYGIKKLLLSEESAEIYNPKVINSTMGSFTRIEWEYCALEKKLSEVEVPIYGALLDGENLHSIETLKPGVIVMGNESKGISPGVQRLVSNSITIPGFGMAESLNVSVATAVIVDSFKRLLG